MKIHEKNEGKFWWVNIGAARSKSVRKSLLLHTKFTCRVFIKFKKNIWFIYHLFVYKHKESYLVKCRFRGVFFSVVRVNCRRVFLCRQILIHFHQLRTVLSIVVLILMMVSSIVWSEIRGKIKCANSVVVSQVALSYFANIKFACIFNLVNLTASIHTVIDNLVHFLLILICRWYQCNFEWNEAILFR